MKKIISVITVLGLSLSFFSTALAADTAYIGNTTAETSNLEQIQPDDFENANVSKYAWKALFKGIKWALVTADNAIYYRSPTIIDEGGNWVATSSGTISFGNGDGKYRRTKHTQKIDVTNNKLDAFAQASPTNWLSKITIFIENSSGEEVAGGQVTHNQHVYTSSNLPKSTYTAYYVFTGEKKWDCWLYRYDFSSSSSSSSTSVNDISANIEKGMVFNPATRKSYVIPSENFDTAALMSSTQSNTTLTGQELLKEFQDDELNCFVDNLKHYSVGDILYVKDVITNLEYNSDDDTTVMYFGNTEDGSFEWPFAGDLRERFEIGDELTFKFNIVEEYSTEEYIFESLDYFTESYDLMEKGTAAEIDTYLVR